MAMVGAFLGPDQVLGALLGTFLTGGVMALAITLRGGGDASLAGKLEVFTIRWRS